METLEGKACSRVTGALCAENEPLMNTRADERIIVRGEREWRIREKNTGTVPGARAACCLICESDDVVRRIWNYPANWRELSDDELLRLCERSSAA
jgi:hypothetical protein